MSIVTETGWTLEYVRSLSSSDFLACLVLTTTFKNFYRELEFSATASKNMVSF